MASVFFLSSPSHPPHYFCGQLLGSVFRQLSVKEYTNFFFKKSSPCLTAIASPGWLLATNASLQCVVALGRWLAVVAFWREGVGSGFWWFLSFKCADFFFFFFVFFFLWFGGDRFSTPVVFVVFCAVVLQRVFLLLVSPVASCLHNPFRFPAFSCLLTWHFFTRPCFLPLFCDCPLVLPFSVL